MMKKIDQAMVLVMGLTSLVACGSTERNATKAEEVDSTAITPESAPEVLERYGRSYVRRDLMTDQEYQRILEDAKPTDAPPTAASIAARLRSHVLVGGVYYVEAEPNLELGEAVLRGDFQNTPGSVPREARTVLHITDGRTHVASPQSYPYRTMAFQNSGCTATKVGRFTMMTAAHCIFNNDVDNWKCANGGAGSSCGGGWPSWRFGSEDSTGFGDFFGSNCGWQGVTSEYVALDGTLETAAKQWTSTRYDFGFIDLTGCTEYTTGWLGTWIAADATLLSMEGFIYGYPRWATCQNGVSGGDPNTCVANRYTGSSPPYGGAELWGMSSTNVQKGPTGYDADTIQSDIDTTNGQSGSALFFHLNPNDLRAVGVHTTSRQSSISTLNGHSRFTGAKYNWLAANSPYPEDTQ